MEFFSIFEVPLIIFLAVVAPVWIIAHYVTRWRMAKSISADDEEVMSDLFESAARMETRIANLEQILDAEVADWRRKI